MRVFTVGEIAEAVGGKLLTGDPKAEVKGFSIDSRTAEAGNMFFPTIGARNDGHDFIGNVIEKGCLSMTVSNEEKVPKDTGLALNVILTKDTVDALQRLSKYYLNTLPLKYKIGVTGSVGKTSTRDMVGCVAARKYRTGKSKKNYNSIYGLPLSILDFEPDTEVAVLEMAMDTFGEIERLADIVRPDIGIITEITDVNLESMKNRENILKAKMEITSFFHKDSLLIVNSSCPLLSEDRVRGEYRLVTVDRGESGRADYEAVGLSDMGDAGIKFTVNVKGRSYDVELPTAGGHNALNAALAIAAGEAIGIAPEEAIEGLKQTELTGKRLRISENNGIKVIDDTYNACELSVKSAINTLAATAGKRRVAILGDIIGLAGKSKESHLSIGRYAAEKGVDLLIAIGEEAAYYAEGAEELMGKDRVYYFPKKEDFIAVMDSMLRKGDTVLVKASRGIELDLVADEILKDKD